MGCTDSEDILAKLSFRIKASPSCRSLIITRPSGDRVVACFSLHTSSSSTQSSRLAPGWSKSVISGAGDVLESDEIFFDEMDCNKAGGSWFRTIIFVVSNLDRSSSSHSGFNTSLECRRSRLAAGIWAFTSSIDGDYSEAFRFLG